MIKKILHLSLINLKYYLFKPLYKTKLILPKPTQVKLNVNLECNSLCKQCNFWKYKKNKKNNLLTQDYKKIILKLKKWLGNYILVFTGGEPTLREDLPELINYASNLGILTILSTNLIVKKEFLLKIINSGLDIIDVSLDGINSKTHDYIRGKKGAFNKVIENIKFIKRKNPYLKIRISTIILKNNLNELEKLIKWVKKENLQSNNFQGLYVIKKNSKIQDKLDFHNKSHLWPDNLKEVNKTIENIIFMKKKGYNISNSIKHLNLMKIYFENPKNLRFIKHKCGINQRLLIAPNGDIKICNLLTKTLGNLLTDNIKLLWKNKYKEIIKKTKKCKKPCILFNCNFEEPIQTKIKKVLMIFKN